MSTKDMALPKDTYLLTDVLPEELELTAFATLKEELVWSEMFHKGGAVPRLVCIQGDVSDDGTEPIYRHPADEQPPIHPWTPTVRKLRDLASKRIQQPLNHALIQLYRSGADYISEHADKTIDVAQGSAVVNLSLGATRTMVIRPKKDRMQKGVPRPSNKTDLPNASLFVLGWDTNRAYTHEIRRDKREDKFKTQAELDFDGCRISLTFRNVATFLKPDGTLFGQGAASSKRFESKAKEEDALIKAFSEENRSSTFDWDRWYGNGFSIVNFKTINEIEGVATNRAEKSADNAPSNEPATVRTNSGTVGMLAIDLQNDFIGEEPFFLGSRGKSLCTRRNELLSRIDSLADEVRSMGCPVIFVRSCYQEVEAKPKPYPHQVARDGLPFNTDFHAGSHCGKEACCVRGTDGAQLHPDAARLVQETDMVIDKQYYSSFTGTTLHQILQRMKVTTLLVCGVTTNNCITATIKDAFHLGYQVILSEDGTATFNPAAQRKALENLKLYCECVLHSQMTLRSVLGTFQPPKVSNYSIRFDGSEPLYGIGWGDSLLIPNFLASDTADKIFEDLLPEKPDGEMEWNELSHLPSGSKFPRLTAYQSSRNDDGHFPSYRCADPQPHDGQYVTKPWSPTITFVKKLVEGKARHNFNWSRILCYRDEKDGMGFHSDKCLDLRVGSFIASLSLGETRQYELKPKKGTSHVLPPQSIRLQHNTLLLLGPKTNQYFTHSVRKGGKSGPRISITFRDLATWYVESGPYPAFYGQGTEFPTFADFEKARTRNRIIEGISLCFLGSAGWLTAQRQKGWIRLAAASLAAAAGSWVWSLARERKWKKQQSMLARVYRLCNILPLASLEARDLALNEKLLDDRSNNLKLAGASRTAATASTCARDA